jgi:hypothetical protein
MRPIGVAGWAEHGEAQHQTLILAGATLGFAALSTNLLISAA